MSIIIGRIENKFGSNSGHKFPNGFPVYSEQEELKGESPNMNDFMSGTIYLYGDSGNHCKYDGAYYSLYIVNLVSHRRKRYLYRLERDLWLDVLTHRPNVVGDLANSNNDKLLEANLNRTVAALDQPARVITINFKQVDFDGRRNFVFRESKKELKQVVLGKDNYRSFLASIGGLFAKNGPYINGLLYSLDRPDERYYTLKKGSNEATFIIGYIPPSYTKIGGKHSLREKINDFVRSIETEEGKKLKIAKVNVTAFENSQLNAAYCITQKVDGISTTEEDVRLKEIDLSGLKDIIPVDIGTLQHIQPNKEINEDLDGGIFDLVEDNPHKVPFLAKIRRKVYIPLNSSGENGVIPKPLPQTDIPYVGTEDTGPFKADNMNGNDSKDPQVVTGSYGSQKGQFNLGYVDNLNFIARYNAKMDIFRGVYATSYFEQYGSATVGGMSGALAGIADAAGAYGAVSGTMTTVGVGVGGAAVVVLGALAGVFVGHAEWRGYANRVISRFLANSYFRWPIPGVHWASPFSVLKEPIVPFGFLIYGLERRHREGRRYEYLEEIALNKLKYGSGIKESIFAKYEKKGEGGSEISPKLAAIQPSITFVKFYLANYYFTGLCFGPAYPYSPIGKDPTIEKLGTPYGAGDRWGTNRHLRQEQYIPELLNIDVYDINEKGAKHNPFNDDRYPAYRLELDRTLIEVLNRSEIELPEGLLVEKGDYFFSDQEYEITEYPHADHGQRYYNLAEGVGAPFTGNGGPRTWYYGANFETYSILSAMPGAFLAEDMMKIPGSKLFAGGADERMVVLCATRDNSIEIRELYTFEREQTISSSSDEIVEAVDGSKTRKTRFTLIKKISKVEFDYKNPEFSDKDKEKIIYAFYKVNGYKVQLVADKGKWTWFNESDFGSEGKTPYLFDLVGTDGYAFIAKGKISLISKKSSLFAPHKGQTNELNHEENKDLELSLLEKINQKVRLQFFNAPYYLNGKTSFTSKDKIRLTVESLSPTDLKTNFDQYFLKLDTEFDTVYYENISVAKKQSRALQVADAAYLERLNLDLSRAQHAYQIDQDRHKINVDRFEESIKRAEIDLYHQKLASGMNLGSGAAGSAFGAGLKGKYRAGRSTTTTIKKGTAMVDDIKASPIALTNAAGVTSVFQPRVEVPTYTKTIKETAGKTPNIIGGLVSGALSSITGAIMDHAFRFPEQQRRIGVDKQIGAAELALDSLAIDTSFMEAQINHQAQLNRITNAYTNPMINEREVMENFMDKEEWHGKKLKPAHLICFVPSEEQLVALKSFKEEYGVMCDIPDVEMNFYEGMNPDVVRYRNLDDDAIRGLPNEGMRVFLHGHLLAGIKIVQTTADTYELITINEGRNHVFRLNSDLVKKAGEIDTKDKQIVLLNAKVVEVEKECAQEAGELQKRIKQVESEMNVVNQQLREKIAELEKAKVKGDEDKAKADELTKQLEALKNDVANKVAELEKAKTQAASDKDKQDALSKEIEKLKQDVNKKAAELEAAKTQSEADRTQQTNLTKQIEQLQGNLTQKIKELEDVQKQYEADKGKHAETSKQLTDAQTKITELEKINAQYDGEKVKYAALDKELKAAKAKVTQLEAMKRQCDIDKRDKANFQRQLNEEKKKVANLNKSLTEKTNSLTQLQRDYQSKIRELDVCKLEKGNTDELNKKIEDLKTESETRKERVEELTQQLNDERRKFLDEQDKANKLDKQYKESQQGYSQLMNDYRQKVAELNRLKERQPASAAPPPTPKEDCSLLQRIMAGSIGNDPVDRDNGWNAFLDLLVALAYSKDIISKRYNPDKGGGGFADAVELAKFLGAVNEIMDLDMVEAAHEMIQEAGGPKYKAGLVSGGDKNGAVDAVIQKFNNLKDYDDSIIHHGLKALLDKANYEAFQVITNMHEKIGRDPELANYLRNVYPGSIEENYKLMYGDPNVEIVRGRFINESQCVERGINVTTALKNYERNTNLGEKTTATVGKLSTSSIAVGTLSADTGKFARRIEEASYCGVLLDSVEIKWPYANPLFMFEDAYETRHLEDVNHKGTFDGRSYTLKDKPKITMALQFGRYIYTREVALVGDSRTSYGSSQGYSNGAERLRQDLNVSGITIEQGVVKNMQLLGFKGRTKDYYSSNSGSWQVRNYVLKQQMAPLTMKDEFTWLIAAVNRIQIPRSLLDGIKNGTRTLRLRQKCFNFTYDPSTQAVVHASKKSTQPGQMILNHSIDLKFGSGNSNEYLQWPEDKIEELLKYLFIFHYFYVAPQVLGKDTTDGGFAYFFLTGPLHPVRKSWHVKEQLLLALNTAIAGITDKKIELQLGGLFNACDQRMWVDGDIPLPSGVAQSSVTVVFMSLFRGIYGHVSGKKKYDHPYDGGTGNIYKMFLRMAQAK